MNDLPSDCTKLTLVISRAVGDRRNEGSVLWNMCLVFDMQGDRVRAITCAQAALEIYEETESPYTEMVRERLVEWQGG